MDLVNKIIDLNGEKSKRIVEEIRNLTSELLISSDPFTRNDVYNTIMEKLDDLHEALARLRR